MVSVHALPGNETKWINVRYLGFIVQRDTYTKDKRSRKSYPFRLRSLKADVLFYFNLLQAYSTKRNLKYIYSFNQ